MTVQMGLLLCLVFMLNSAATGSKGGHQIESQTYGNISPMNSRNRKPSCHSIGGQCTKRKDTCPIWLPLEKPYGRPYCPKKRRCCYRDSCPNPIFEYFHVCATCNSSEDAFAFVIELWGQPSTNPRNTTVFDGHNITYTSSEEYNRPSCQSSFVDTWDCFKDFDGYWTNCKKKNGNGGCRSDHALNNGHLFPNILCYKDPATEVPATGSPILLSGDECGEEWAKKYAAKNHVCTDCDTCEKAREYAFEDRSYYPPTKTVFYGTYNESITYKTINYTDPKTEENVIACQIVEAVKTWDCKFDKETKKYTHCDPEDGQQCTGILKADKTAHLYETDC